MAAPSHYQLYRNSTLGMTLTDSLDELVRDRELTPQLAIKVLQIFDKSVAEVFRTTVRAKNTFKGRLVTYRSVEDVWTFTLGDTQFRFEGGETIQADRVRITACTARRDAGAAMHGHDG